MRLLRTALEALTAAIEGPGSLTTLIGSVEFALAPAIAPGRVTIALGDGPDEAPGHRIPLRIDGRVIGSIRVDPPADEREGELLDTLGLLAAPIAAAITARRRPDRRDSQAGRANIDTLCRIANRRGFDERMAAAWESARDRAVPLIVALIDVDFFKAYNDRYGHVAGDLCLQTVASLLVRRREGDDGFAARYGGEEFAIIFEDQTVEGAVAAMQQVVDRLAARNIEHAGTTLGRVSFSVGIAAVVPTDDGSTQALVEEADRSLYTAKHFGRNRICAGSFVSEAPLVAKLAAPARASSEAEVPTFGREDDLARILSALRYARMVTLVGPAGIGKSRLLTLLAGTAAARLHRHVVFLAPELLRAGMDPATALASACDLTLGDGGALDTVTEFLADREAVLILDDVEGARAPIRSICNHLIARTAGVSIVAAARANVGVAGERAIVVAPLADEAALALLTLGRPADEPSAREILRYLGGNPASIKAAADVIERVGIGPVSRRLAAAGKSWPDAADLAAFLSNGEAAPAR